MHKVLNLLDRIKKYFAFSPKEIKSMVIAILVLGLVVGFNDGRDKFIAPLWLMNLFNSIVVVALAVLVRESARRISGLKFAHKVEMKLWLVGLGIALIASLISNGKLWFLAYGGMVVSLMPKQRIGSFRYGISYHDMAGMAYAAVFANLALAGIFRMLSFLPSPLIDLSIKVNVLFAILNMIPIPPLDGSVIFFGSRGGYIFSLALTAAYSVLILYTGIVVSLLGSLAFAALAIVLFIIYVE